MMRASTARNAALCPVAGSARTTLIIAAALVVAGAALAITHYYRQEKEVGARELPIVFVLSPDHGRNLGPEDRRAFEELLERESGLHIDILVAANPLDAIEAFGGGGLGEDGAGGDIGLLNLFEYALARKEYGAEAGLQTLRAGAATGYRGVIVVRAADPIQSIDGLGGKRIAFVDPYSTSGFVFTAQLLRDAKIDVRPEFTGGHDKALERLRAGAVDAAATYASAVDGDSGLRVIARTETIPNEPVFFRRDLRAEQRVALANALVKIASTPDGARLLRLTADITGFRPATDDDYSEVVDVIRAAGKSVYEVVPEGLRVESRRRGINYIP
jgi:phosphonate transport system substrate-binding protein